MSLHNPEAALPAGAPGNYDYEEDANPLPRSVVRPNDFVLLDGEWNFALDEKNAGLNELWYIGHAYTQTAAWPGSLEALMAKNASTWQDEIVVWYERSFENPAFLREHSTTPKLLQLTFGACGYETRVWLNGQPLRTIEGAEAHIGEYTSFSFELPDALLQPVNRLTVRIADTMDADVPRGKQESHVYKRGGIWYQTSSGATRSVWIEPVERNRLRTRVGVVSVVEDNLVRVNLTTRIHDPGNYVIRLKVYERKGTEPVATDEFPLWLNAGQKSQRVVIELPEATLWSPENPHLYRLVAELVDSAGHAAQIETEIGFRKIEARGSTIYLNNVPVYLDGILYQPGDASYEEMGLHMRAMKDLGCNLVRIHIAGVDPRIYHLADKLGLLLWVEVPSPHASTERSRINHEAELLRMLRLIESHPSVVIWSLYNEDWGAQDIATNAATREYITRMYHFMQINYPQFLVVDNDGWQHISLEGRLKSDMLTAHLYTPDIGRWREMLDGLTAGQLNGVAFLPLTVGDPFFYRRQVPLVVSEWGGFGFSNYGGPEENADRASLIKSFKDELRKRHIAGDVYTQATDIEDERNGIIDFKTGALKVAKGLLNSRG